MFISATISNTQASCVLLILADAVRVHACRRMFIDAVYPAIDSIDHTHKSCSHIYVPSGKHTKNYRKSPLFMGKLTINGDFP